MGGYVGVIPRSSIDRIFDQLFEKFKDEKQFQDILDNEDLKNQIKDSVFSAIDTERLQLTALRDPAFAQNLVLAFVTSYIVEKYNKDRPNMPKLDMNVLFKKELDDPFEYQHLLAKLLTEVLIERNKLLPQELQLTEAQIHSKVNELMSSSDPKQEFVNVLGLLAKEQLLKDQMQPNPENAANSENKDDKEEKKAELRPQPASQKNQGVLGVTDVPVSELQITDLSGPVTSSQPLESGLIAAQRVSELKANAGELNLFISDLTDIAKEAVAQEALTARLTH